eukprot:TRINITY_DN10843_c0_g3_i1.p1 TRINITY_DN10843_c0_g3~~TRINITY_DN10843_c0_g3_i1.p1  ORF type:complete len:140 (+),score=14.60 TRINITY_DN10843_c0_g3_i1:62-481(+)
MGADSFAVGSPRCDKSDALNNKCETSSAQKQWKPLGALATRKNMMIAHKQLIGAIVSADAKKDESKDSGKHGPPQSRRTAYDLGYDGDMDIGEASVVPPCGRYTRSSSSSSKFRRGNGGHLTRNVFAGSGRPRLVRYSL